MIQCIVDDLGFVAADAVLRAADAALEPVSASARALDRQGGDSLTRARQMVAELEAGAAVVTAGGELAAPLVVHLVLQARDVTATRDTVRRALQSAWRRCAEWGITRIAGAPVGAGPGLFDVDDAARLMASTLAEGAPEVQLTIVVEREAEREMIEAALRARPA